MPNAKTPEAKSAFRSTLRYKTAPDAVMSTAARIAKSAHRVKTGTVTLPSKPRDTSKPRAKINTAPAGRRYANDATPIAYDPAMVKRVEDGTRAFPEYYWSKGRKRDLCW